VSGSASAGTCKSAVRCRQITTLAPYHSVFYRLDALPVAKATASRRWRYYCSNMCDIRYCCTTCVDYCNSVLAAAPKTTTDKLQRVLNAAACVISNTRKFDRGLSQLLHDELRWLDVPDRVAFKLIVTVHRCLNDRAPNYLLNHVIPVSAIVSRQHFQSAQQNTLVVPRYRLTTYGHRAFSVAGLTAWNSLPVAFRDPTMSDACFRRHLKTVLFAQQRRHHSV